MVSGQMNSAFLSVTTGVKICFHILVIFFFSFKKINNWCFTVSKRVLGASSKIWIRIEFTFLIALVLL